MLAYLAGNAGVQYLLNLAIVRAGKLEKFGHIDIHANTNSVDNAGAANREIESKLRANDINFLAHLEEDGLSLLLVKVNAIRVLIIKSLAGLVVAEKDMGVVAGRSDVDALNHATMDKRQNLGRRAPSGRKSLDNDASNLSG